ncbi:hypothetical protein FYK55_15215 [Roseiconus nitratireducens]|uniref:DUF2069 domain-containing protein n=1 Tax=Roseiconus nitratireducens TaxID=2605748 RepID=A0A5M6D3R9_9BACT|nr:hypothetical protein [Roseiconus nitratireducens]KAA5542157.1 hypothetical protein FYK55_15215 [Roseiconus nitratireducens]
MFQFTIRKILWVTLYCALCFAFVNVFGFDTLFAFHIFGIHFIVLCVLPVAVLEYRGFHRRFSIAALVVEVLFLWITYNEWYRDDFLFGSLIAFAMAYVAGILAAAAYRAIKLPDEPRDSWRPLDIATRALAKLLPSADA